MKNFKSHFFITLIILILIPAINFAQTNVALSATVTTSHVSPWETLGAVNDGYTPSSSTDNSNGAYGNWDGSENYNTYNYVQYEWSSAITISSTRVYWWDDGAGIDQPTNAYIQYYSNGSWVTAANIGIALNQWNSLTLNISTTGLRIYMISAMATGILEWEVYNGGSSCDPSTTTPYTQINDGTWSQTNIADLSSGDKVKFGPWPTTGGSWSWSGPNSFSATTREVTINNIQTNQAGTYAATYTNDCGAQTVQNFYVTVSGGGGSSYIWPSYNPTISYNFSDDYGTLPAPTNVLNSCTNYAGTQTSAWWCFRWGPSANSLVTSAAITPMLQRFETDFAYFTDEMGWPRDARAQAGYKSAIYLYGSGLCTDNASNTDLGGWQSAVGGYPIVLASYYPVYSFDPACTYNDKVAQQGAMVHEGIHCVLASLPGCQNAAWFHEGGNTWLQQEADSRRSQSYNSMGFLNAGAMIAPFMPIECYSGWLQDGTFGGPSAEGVNMFSGSQQICTWKNLLGGTQYGNMFPTLAAQILGDGAIPWIWKNCTSRVLEGMSAALGDTQTRRLISEYRAKQAVIDVGPWKGAVTALLDANMGVTIQEEWSPYNVNCDPWTATPYAVTTNNSGTLTPAYWTLPGWSGANQIPLTVSGSTVSVNFQPIGSNMTCQLCYIATDGTRVYSELVSSGTCSLSLTKAPANNVVIAVITSTDYIYQGESTRAAKYDYRLTLGTGVTGTADVHSAWYKGNEKSAVVDTYEFFDVSKYCSHNYNSNKPEATSNLEVAFEGNEMLLFPNPVNMGQMVHIKFKETCLEPVNVQVMNLQGQLVYSECFENNVIINTSELAGRGVYMVNVHADENIQSYRLIVR